MPEHWYTSVHNSKHYNSSLAVALLVPSLLGVVEVWNALSLVVPTCCMC
jgi:hypothetical protein